MQKKIKLPFSNLTFENWQNLIILAVVVFISFWGIITFGNGTILSGFGVDYLAFWSAGKIADEKGYAQIYNLENLKSVQLQELDKLGLLEKIDATSYAPLPVALLPVFVFPFQGLSKINLELSYWIWTLLNLVVLIGYLFSYTKKIFPDHLEIVPELKLLLLMLISYPVWANFAEGQVEIFLVVCAGEFVRQAIKKKPLLSGLWLGGLLLKPQLLVLIIPTLMLMRYWKAMLGFIFSSLILLMTSFLLSGFTGMKAMVELWTKYSAGIATSAPQMMINWRMIGVNINSLFGTSIGWVITGLGMVLTVVLVYLITKAKPSFGSSAWIITMAVVFSATLAVTWHAHHHMAVVLIPFLIYASQLKLLPGKVILSWATVTIILLVVIQMIALLFFFITKKTISDMGFLVAISGFCLNLLVLFSSLRYLKSRLNTPETLPI